MARPDRIRSVPTDPHPRLEGDALFAWSQLMLRQQQFDETRESLAAQMLEQRGFTPGEYLLDPRGYILSRQDVQRLEQEQRDRQPQPGPVHSPDSGS